MPVRAFVVALVVAVACVFAGCGGGREQDEKANAYANAVNAVQERFSTSVARTETSTRRSTVTAATVNRLTTAVDRMARDLRSIDPPASVDRLHARLIAEVTDFHAALGDAKSALRSGDRATILAERAQLLSSAKRVTRRTQATLKRIDRTLRA